MAKGLALRVRLGVGGRIAEVEIIADAGRGVQWTLRDGQHNGFPGLRLGEAGKDDQLPKGLLSLGAVAREVHERAWGCDKTPVEPARRTKSVARGESG